MDINAAGSAAPSAFVGRDDELSQGLSILEEALSGRARLLLISGQAGIGKTRNANELAARA